jgi:RHS repeat-associated protein
LGSVRFVVNAATGSVVQELRYDTFGQVLLDTNPGFQPFGFAGGLYDPDTSLTRFGVRDYDSQIGRWTARDPLAFGGGQANLYIYAGNDPVNLVDPNGGFAIPALVLGAMAVFEFGMTVYDFYDVITTFANPCADRIDKAISVFGLVAGLAGPAGGYGKAAKTARKACFTEGTLVTTTDGLVEIENVQVGDRAAQLNGEECFSEPIEDPSSCAVVTIEFANEDGLRVELMRSSDWLEKNKVEVGGMVHLALEELDVDGDGHVVAMSSCPVIIVGLGCVVTGTFQRTHDDVLELSFVDSTLVLQPTSSHPLWSEDRNDWVRAGQLRVGEYLRSESGPLEISSIQQLDGIHQVFNLEVAGNHTYLVGADAVLSHNTCDLHFDDYNKARNAALDWLEKRGFKAKIPTEGKFPLNPNQGKPVGMSTADGKTGFRVEFTPDQGSHINVFNVKEKGPHLTFPGDQDTVNQIVKRFLK